MIDDRAPTSAAAPTPKPRPRWRYGSENFAGNFHQTVESLNKYYPHWDVAAMSYSGNYTVVVYREPLSGKGRHV